MNTGGHREFKDTENPFAFNTEPNSFTFFADDTTAQVPAGAGDVDRNASMSTNLFKLKLWNIILRFATFGFCLAAVMLIALSRQSNSEISYAGHNAEATYHFSGSFVFFLYVNIAVMGYALALSICALVMGRKGEGQTTPAALMRPAIVLNVVHATVLIIAFSVALAVEVTSRNGLSLGSVKWEPICDYFSTFCTVNEIGLASCAAAYLCLLASTAIDAYYIHLFS